MFLLQFLDPHPHWQSTGTPDFKTIIVDGQTHCSSGLSIVPMAECVDKRFPQRNRRKERLIHTLKQSGFDAACYRQVPSQKLHGFR